MSGSGVARPRPPSSRPTEISPPARGGKEGTVRLSRIASPREIRAQDGLALEAARLETAVGVGDLVEGDALGDARLDGARCQQAEEPLQVLPEQGGMARPRRVDRVEAGTLATGQPAPEIQA